MTKVTKRKSQSGIVLISTLLSLSLLTMFALTIQAKSFASAKTYRKLIQATEVDAAKASVRELARPLVLEAMIDFDSETQLELDGSPFELDWRGRPMTLTAQDVEGLAAVHRSTPRDLLELLPPDLAEVLRLMQTHQPNPMPMLQSFAQFGGDLRSYPDPSLWFSDSGRLINRATLPLRYGAKSTAAFIQPKAAIFHVW